MFEALVAHLDLSFSLLVLVIVMVIACAAPLIASNWRFTQPR